MKFFKYFGYGHIALDCANKRVGLLKDDEKVSLLHSSSSSYKC